jgi:hypothetical protein
LDTTTTVTAGPSYTAGTAAVAIQLQIPAAGTILIKEWGVTFATSQTTQANVVLRTTATGSTVTTAHTTTSVKTMNTNNINAGASRLTYGATTNTGYGNGTITSATSIKQMGSLYVPNAYVYQAALGDEFEAGAAAIEYVQLIINAGVTSLAKCWIKWMENI